MGSSFVFADDRLRDVVSDDPLVEVDDVPVIYADGIASAYEVSGVVHMVMYRFQYRDGRRVRVPILELVRPVVTWEPNVKALLARYGRDKN